MKMKTLLSLIALSGVIGIYSAHAYDLGTDTNGVDQATSDSDGNSLDNLSVFGWHPPGHPGPGPIHPPFHPGPGHPWHPAPVHPEPIHFQHGGYPWHHWDHPYFARPVFYWNWEVLRSVTCISQDSAGDQFPVTEEGYYGYEYQAHLDEIEDASLDRCFDETGGDPGCFLVECVAGY